MIPVIVPIIAPTVSILKLIGVWGMTKGGMSMLGKDLAKVVVTDFAKNGLKSTIVNGCMDVIESPVATEVLKDRGIVPWSTFGHAELGKAIASEAGKVVAHEAGDVLKTVIEQSNQTKRHQIDADVEKEKIHSLRDIAMKELEIKGEFDKDTMKLLLKAHTYYIDKGDVDRAKMVFDIMFMPITKQK
jgi:hypothetical protein